MTLAAEDTNSIPTDNADRAFQGNVTIQVTQPGGYWAITLQCLFIVHLMSSVAQQQSFTVSLTGL